MENTIIWKPVWKWWISSWPALFGGFGSSDFLQNYSLHFVQQKETAECYKIGPLPLISRVITSFITLSNPISYGCVQRLELWGGLVLIYSLGMPNSSCSCSSLPSTSTWRFLRKVSWWKSRQWRKRNKQYFGRKINQKLSNQKQSSKNSCVSLDGLPFGGIGVRDVAQCFKFQGMSGSWATGASKNRQRLRVRNKISTQMIFESKTYQAYVYMGF